MDREISAEPIIQRRFALNQTCGACPESYDAFFNGEQVGYLRLRHGRFTVECPDSGGELVYTAKPDGDGVFMDRERAFYLGEAKEAILGWVRGRKASYEQELADAQAEANAEKASRVRRTFEKIAGEVVKPDSPETLSFQKLVMQAAAMPDDVMARIADILDTPDTEH